MTLTLLTTPLRRIHAELGALLAEADGHGHEPDRAAIHALGAQLTEQAEMLRQGIHCCQMREAA